jgi:K(+)-stimulated pyrophosphate-energized sodium pump
MNQLVYLLPAAGLLALLFTFFRSRWIARQPAGNEQMQRIGGFIQEGAMAFLKAEYSVLAGFVVVVAALLAWQGAAEAESSPLVALSFVSGAVCSALAGLIGMRVATKANVRTTNAARTGLNEALRVAFNGGSVMGMGVVGLGLLGLSVLFIYYAGIFGTGDELTVNKLMTVLTGFSFGASSIALFARVGGGIYTKAADVGADLVGKVEAGIPEDHPLNPATIADNVGDNVGDVAGMGADLFESYVGAIVGTMVIGVTMVALPEFQQQAPFGSLTPILLPMFMAGAGIVVSIIGTFFVRVREGGNPQAALNAGQFVAAGLLLVATWFLVTGLLPAQWTLGGVTYTAPGVFWAAIAGLVAGVAIGLITEYYTGYGKKPVLDIVQQSLTGTATNIIAGLGVGMRSTALPILILAASVIVAYHMAGLYGIAIAAVGMLANTGIQLAVDAYGPISDNAGGVAEMSRLPKEVRGRTDKLDAVGNTTAAIGKGFAIASAALTALALFSAFMSVTGLKAIDISHASVMAMLFVGAMLPFLFSAMALGAVGRAAMAMIQEVRRQFSDIKELRAALDVMRRNEDIEHEYWPKEDQAIFEDAHGKAEYGKCVEISTKAAIRQMILPGLLAVFAPVAVGFAFKWATGSGAEALGGLLAGVTVSGVLLAIFQANSGGAWDNAKKMFEEGVEIAGQKYYKGSEPHKAAVVGDTVGDPFKDTAGPSINILLKLISIVALVIGPLIR